MWRCLSGRASTLLGLFHIISLLVVTSTTAVDGSRRRVTRVRRGGGGTAEPTTRDRDDGPGAPAEDAAGSCRCAADQWEGILRSVDREFYLDGQRLRAAELESNTAIHYDFRNALFASLDFDTGIKTVIDHNMVIYIFCAVVCRCG